MLLFIQYEKLGLNILGNVFPIEYFYTGEYKKIPSFKLSGAPQTAPFLQTLAGKTKATCQYIKVYFFLFMNFFSGLLH